MKISNNTNYYSCCFDEYCVNDAIEKIKVENNNSQYEYEFIQRYPEKDFEKLMNFSVQVNNQSIWNSLNSLKCQ